MIRRTSGFAALALAAVLPLWPSAASSAQEPPVPADAPTMPLEQVVPGMRGVGYTVMQGVDPVPFDVEILGILPDVFPKQSLIVGRLTGLGLEKSGVIAGMSGSPVVVDGRVIGAIAYRLTSFGHEAIAGILPIGDMLAIGDRPVPERVVVGRPPVRESIAAVAAAVTGQGGVPASALHPVTALPGLQPIDLPLSFGGLQPSVVRAVAPVFESMGWSVGVGAGTAPGAGADGMPIAGGAIGVQLVRGDISVAASGTVTYRRGNSIFAFGHPFLQSGAVDFPLVPAEVITILSGSQSSSKLSVTGDRVVGAIRQDRLPAIVGELGENPAMVPVHAAIHGVGLDDTLDFEIVADPLMTPLYMFLGLVNGVQSLDAVTGQGSVQVQASIHLRGGQVVRIDDLYSSPNQAIVSVGSSLAGIFVFLYDNAFEPVDIAEVELDVAMRRDRKIATVERVWADRSVVRPGDTVRVGVQLRPYREEPTTRTFDVVIPSTVSPGSLTLLVGDAETVNREQPGGPEPDPRDLAGLLARLNEARRNDRVYLQLSRPGRGAIVAGEVMPDLPSSLLDVLQSSQASGDVVLLQRIVLAETSAPVEYVVAGSQKIQLTVRRP